MVQIIVSSAQLYCCQCNVDIKVLLFHPYIVVREGKLIRKRTIYTYMHNPGRPMVLPPHTLTFLLRVLRNDRTSKIISCKRKNKQDFQKIIENTALLPNGKALFNTSMYTDNYFKIYIIEGRGNQQLLSQAYILQFVQSNFSNNALLKIIWQPLSSYSTIFSEPSINITFI